MPFPILPSNSANGYFLTKSLRFRSSASAYLNRTPGSAGNRQIWTYSFWCKKPVVQGSGGTYCYPLTAGTATGGNSYAGLQFYQDTLVVFDQVGGGANNIVLQTTQVFRDPSAWYHFVVAVDTTQATSTNRVKVYLNGTQITAFGTAIYPSQNYSGVVNNTVNHGIDAQWQGSWSVGTDLYLAEVNLVDGQALTPSSFGSTNATTGVWQPAKYSGTYGTNGFYLPFTNTTSTTTLGYDFSGNSNNWTTNNLSLTTGTTYDSMTDVPTLTSATTANYPTSNPLLNLGGNVTLSAGNLTQTRSGNGNYIVPATMAIPAGVGKWYWEVTVTTQNALGNFNYGVIKNTINNGTWNNNADVYWNPLSGGATVNRNRYGTVTTGAVFTVASGDLLGFALDSTTGDFSIYKNGTLVETWSGAVDTAYSHFPFTSCYSTGEVFSYNFGQQGFTYTPPTGFVALNTYNLPTSTIVKGSSYFNVGLWTSNSSAANIPVTGIGFQPSFFWGKLRSVGTSHRWVDAIRGVTKMLSSNTTGSEQTETDAFASFDSDGFTIGKDTTGGGLNYLSNTGVGWVWKGNGSGVSNTDGSITSTVSASASSGFSVVTFTAGSGASPSYITVGHGLGVAPNMVIVKRRGGVGAWYVYHTSLATPATQWLQLNTTDAVQTATPFWGSSGMTSSTLGFSDNLIINSSTYVAYCFAQIAGYSAFGSYTGNGSSDGPFIYTGFSPSFVMVKRTDTTGNWFIVDDKRLGYNGGTKNLYPNLSNAEATLELDLISNGFKWRLNGADVNASGGTFIYMAFAENPFKNALAR
jgi:hypothetical protein